MAKKRPTETLADLLKLAGLTTRKAAERAGVSPVTLWNWVTRDAAPSRLHLAAVAKALGVTVERLLAAIAASRKG